MSVESDDDDTPQLSAEALKALHEFYEETKANSDNITEDWVYFFIKRKRLTNL